MLTGEIPLPPFDSVAEARLFHDLIEYFLFRIDPDNRHGLRDTTVWNVLGRHLPTTPEQGQPAARGLRSGHGRSGQVVCTECATAYPCRMVLASAMTCRFPAPWTPATLAWALRRAGDEEWAYAKIERTELAWGVTEMMTAHRTASGWALTRRYRGASALLADDLADDELCTWILAGLRTFALPDGLEAPALWPPDIPDYVLDPELHAEAVPSGETETRRGKHAAPDEPPTWMPGFGDEDR